MARCVFEDRIDAYLRGELAPEEEARFEEHYFNCPACFRETAERSALRDALKAGGEAIFRERPRRIPAWAYAATAAAVFLIAVILSIPPSPPKPSPLGFSGEEAVRGEGLSVVGPSGVLAAPPDRLEWRPASGAAAYEVTLSAGEESLWSAGTTETSILLPSEIRSRIQPGRSYLWRVRAYAAEGRRIAVSEPSSFSLAR